MDPVSLRQIERLYHAALARPSEERAAFLAEACADDEPLRQEVASLLEKAASAHGFLAAPAVGRAVDVAVADVTAIAGPRSARMLGSYRIEALIGRGGMGEVYRAHDTKLGRDVAIKVLPPAFAYDADRRRRFEREARVLATLNHPHIAAIYGFEEGEIRGSADSGPAEAGHYVRGLVLELVEGPTLAERLTTGPLPLHQALTTALQIAQGFEAAHAKGIIHRDLKPANIKVTPGGVVKILDFGLAKVWTADLGDVDVSQAATVTTTGTREGALLGTAAYMSPEQARAKPVDTRTDVWAFGCVLYEMLAGRPVFEAETLSDTLARILEREPDWQQLPRFTPARVRDLLRCCLQKDPAKRLSDVAEARRDLEACLASPFTIPLAVLESVRWSISRPMVRASLAAIAMVVAGLTIYALRERDRPVPRLTNPVQVTAAIGVEDYPSWTAAHWRTNRTNPEPGTSG